MTKTTDTSANYAESDAAAGNRTLRPIPSPGIGRRIGEAAELVGTRTSAYKVMGISSAALQRYIKEENAPPFEAVARLCVAAGVSLDWLATGEGEMRQTASDKGSQPARLDHETLRLAVQVLDKALESANASTDSAGRAELLVAIYELLEQGAAQEAAQRVVATMLRAASKAAGVPSKQG